MPMIAYGASSRIRTLRPSTVVKSAWEGFEGDIVFEREVYEFLGPHPRITRYIGPHPRSQKHTGPVAISIELEYYKNGCIDQARAKHPEIPYIRWAEQIAEGLVFLHGKGVIHCDVRSANILVTDTWDVVLADFGSSSMNGVKVSNITNKTRYCPPKCDDEKCHFTVQDDIFAFGSLMYYFVTAKEPYQDISSDDEIIALYNAGTFPDTSQLPHGTLIEKCWHGDYSSAAQLLDDIRSARSPY